MGGKRPIDSPVRRLVKLGSLVGRVGASVATDRIAGVARSESSRAAHRSTNLARNAARIVETLGELKGAAMKVGQMASLHAVALPPEVAAVLSNLQKEAPRIPFEVVEEELESALPGHRKLFAWIQPEAFAAASIGQVHRAVLRDGRQVAVKVQYPLIDRIIEADLGNLRRALATLLSLVADVDFEPIWQELSARLREELDYEREAATMRRMSALHAGVPDIVIPGVVEEASSRTVLTMEYVAGLTPDEACSDRVAQELRDRWGVALFDFMQRGLLVHRLLHADPNLANFAFLEDGRVVVYDFGCVKEVPVRLARGYRAVDRALLDGRDEEIPGLLAGMGLAHAGGIPLEADLIEPYLEVTREVLRSEPPYRFGEDEELYRRLFDVAWASVDRVRDFQLPRDMVFVNRTVAGHFGNLTRLGSSGPWRERVEHWVEVAGRKPRSGASS